MASITISPVVVNYKKRDGTYPVKIRVTYKRKKKMLSTNIFAEQKQLTKELAIKDPSLMKEVGDVIKPMRDAVKRIDLYTLEDMDVDDVVRLILSATEKEDEFRLDFFEYGERIASEKPKGSRTNYMCALHSFKAFVGVDEMDISMVSSAMMHNYEQALRTKYGDGSRALSMYPAAIAYIHKRAQKEFNEEEFGRIRIRNPFSYYTPPKQRMIAHRDVDASVIGKMLSMRKELTGNERLGVDLFLISFGLMGMNTPDIFTCAYPVDGVITYERTKTRERRFDRAEMHVKIDELLLPLWEEYKDPDRVRAFSFYHRCDTYKYLGRIANLGLGDFFKRIGEKKATMYSARHTWSTLAYEAGVDEGVINDCTCHIDPDMKVTDIYVKKDWKVMWKANAKVMKKYFKPNTKSSRPKR